MLETRHQIHANPELAFEEFKTSDLVAERLTRWGYQVHRGLAGMARCRSWRLTRWWRRRPS